MPTRLPDAAEPAAEDPHCDSSGIASALAALRECELQRQALAEELVQAHKMRDIATLAGGIAHETNNMMTVVLGFGSQLAREMEPGDPRLKLLAEMTRAAERTAQMTSQLLQFSRRRVARADATDLGQALSGIESLIRRLVVQDRAIAFDIERPPLPLVARIDRNQLEQVILNLAINARDAMPEGGVLRIRLDHLELHSPLPLGPGAVMGPGSYVRLRVEDSGIGMSPPVLERAFEPFFTTKVEGKGTGLGLHVVKGIVAQSGGHIEVTSQVGKGTRWTLYLPRIEEAPVARDRISDEIRVTKPCGGTVLVVDDEPPIRSLADYALSRAGFDVLQADNGAEALALLDSGAAVDLVLTDLTMPSMSGLELARRISLRRPHLPVVFMTGHPEEVVFEAQPDAARSVLRKPFRSSELAQAVRTVLAQRLNAPG